MHENENLISPHPKRVPWNKGKLIGPQPPLRQRHVWAIRTRLQIEQQVRDLALFNLAVDSKLRGCDLVAIRVDDVAPNGYAIERASVRQRKTGRPVRFELMEQTRQAINDYLAASGNKPGEYLFNGQRPGQSMTTRQYARLLAECRGRARPTFVRYTLPTSYQGNVDLPPDRKSAGGPASSWAHQDREHRAVFGQRC
jgi:integrase